MAGTRRRIPPKWVALYSALLFGIGVVPVGPAIVAGPVSRSKTVRRGDVHTYSIWMPARGYGRVELAQQDIDLTLEAVSPKGKPLITMNASPWGWEAVSLISEEPGIYKFRIRAPMDDSLAGSYTIRFAPVRPARGDDARVLKAQSEFLSGIHAVESGLNVQAESLLQRAASDARIAGDRRREGQALALLGVLDTRTGKYESALSAFGQACDLWVALKDKAAFADSLRGLSALSNPLKARFSSRASFENYLEAWRQVTDRRARAIVFTMLGEAAWEKGDVENEIVYHRKALGLRRRIGAPLAIAASLEDLAKAEISKSSLHSLARRDATEALRLHRANKNTRGEASCLYLLGIIDQDDQPDRALAELENSKRLRHAQGDLSAESNAFLSMAKIEYTQGRYAAAARDSDEARMLDETLDALVRAPLFRAGFMATHSDAGEQILALMHLHEQFPTDGYAEKALKVADETIAHHLRDPSGQLQTINLRSAVPDASTTILEYWLSPQGCTAWAVTQDGITAFALPSVSRVQALAKRLMADLEKGRDTSLVSARELTGLLLAPVANRLRDRILIAGNGPIETLPFSMLPDPADDSKLLIDKHEISYLPSIGAVLELRKRRPSKAPVSELAVFADPVFDQNDSRVSGHLQSEPPSAVLMSAVRALAFPSDTTLWRLPYSSREAENVIAPIRQGRWSVYSGLAANRENFLRVVAGGYRVIHVATHALNNDSDPALSGLILSLVGPNGERRNGFVPWRTIYEGQVRAELVVLSACETADGQELLNEGVLGMTSAFLYAGAGRVLSTAWKIDDQGTAELMGHFYRALYESPRMSPVQALRVAQLQMRNVPRWHSPYYWSGFLLHGDWSWKW